MSKFTLIIGNKNISSWSLRGYLMMKHGAVDFEEILIALRPHKDRQSLIHHTPAGKVPTLKHDDKFIWDSLAIGEYLNDLYPEKLYWPDNIDARAHARCVSAEMHSGFAALRNLMPMACHSIFDEPQMSDQLKVDIDRIIEIWQQCFDQYGGPYLFGGYCIADMMFAPVVSRFITFQIDLPDKLKAYCAHMMKHPHMMDWMGDCDITDI